MTLASTLTKLHAASPPTLTPDPHPRDGQVETALKCGDSPAEGGVATNPNCFQGVVSTLATGILHGCSGSGHLLGVMPALTMPSWRIATTYLVSFGAGTALAMSIFTAVVGEVSLRMSEMLDDPRTPGRLALASSIFALLMGTIWTGKAVASFGWPTRLIRRLAAV